MKGGISIKTGSWISQTNEKKIKNAESSKSIFLFSLSMQAIKVSNAKVCDKNEIEPKTRESESMETSHAFLQTRESS